MAPMNQSSQ